MSGIIDLGNFTADDIAEYLVSQIGDGGDGKKIKQLAGDAISGDTFNLDNFKNELFLLYPTKCQQLLGKLVGFLTGKEVMETKSKSDEDREFEENSDDEKILMETMQTQITEPQNTNKENSPIPESTKTKKHHKRKHHRKHHHRSDTDSDNPPENPPIPNEPKPKPANNPEHDNLTPQQIKSIQEFSQNLSRVINSGVMSSKNSFPLNPESKSYKNDKYDKPQHRGSTPLENSKYDSYYKNGNSYKSDYSSKDDSKRYKDKVYMQDDRRYQYDNQKRFDTEMIRPQIDNRMFVMPPRFLDMQMVQPIQPRMPQIPDIRRPSPIMPQIPVQHWQAIPQNHTMQAAPISVPAMWQFDDINRRFDDSSRMRFDNSRRDNDRYDKRDNDRFGDSRRYSKDNERYDKYDKYDKRDNDGFDSTRDNDRFDSRRDNDRYDKRDNDRFDNYRHSKDNDRFDDSRRHKRDGDRYDDKHHSKYEGRSHHDRYDDGSHRNGRYDDKYHSSMSKSHRSDSRDGYDRHMSKDRR